MEAKRRYFGVVTYQRSNRTEKLAKEVARMRKERAAAAAAAEKEARRVVARRVAKHDRLKAAAARKYNAALQKYRAKLERVKDEAAAADAQRAAAVTEAVKMATLAPRYASLMELQYAAQVEAGRPLSAEEWRELRVLEARIKGFRSSVERQYAADVEALRRRMEEVLVELAGVHDVEDDPVEGGCCWGWRFKRAASLIALISAGSHAAAAAAFPAHVSRPQPAGIFFLPGGVVMLTNKSRLIVTSMPEVTRNESVPGLPEFKHHTVQIRRAPVTPVLCCAPIELARTYKVTATWALARPRLAQQGLPSSGAAPRALLALIAAGSRLFAAPSAGRPPSRSGVHRYAWPCGLGDAHRGGCLCARDVQGAAA